MSRLVDIFYEELDPIFPTIANFTPSFAMMPISVAQITHSKQSGGNPLGLSDEEGPLTLLNLAISWSDAADDAKVFAMSDRIMSRIQNFAKSVGGLKPWLYKNYADEDQDVFSSYGAENKAKLQEVARAVDPEGIFQTLQPKYHRLF